MKITIALQGQHTFDGESDSWGFQECYEDGGTEAVKELIMEDWPAFLDDLGGLLSMVTVTVEP